MNNFSEDKNLNPQAYITKQTRLRRHVSAGISEANMTGVGDKLCSLVGNALVL